MSDPRVSEWARKLYVDGVKQVNEAKAQPEAQPADDTDPIERLGCAFLVFQEMEDCAERKAALAWIAAYYGYNVTITD